MMVGAVKDRVRSTQAEASGRGQELSALFDQHYRSLRGLAFIMLGDSARSEEVVMEAFVKAFTGWERFKRVDHPHAYLRQVVVNLCRSRFRREQVEHRVNALVHRRDESSVQPEQEDRLDLWAAVRRLPDRQRAVVVLRYLEDMTEREIADTLECSVGTVKSQLHKAKAKLERELEGANGGGRP